MTGDIDRTDLKVALSALHWVRHTLTARSEPTTAIDRTITRINAALTTSATGTPTAPTRHTEYVDTATAAQTLRCTQRWVCELAPHIGGIKQGGRWLIPKDSLPQEDQ